MIKKIKKYKIAIRPSFVQRAAKKKLDTGLDPESLERAVQTEIEKISTMIVPSAIYNTFSRTGTPEPLTPLWQNVPNHSLSISLIIATIGMEIEKEIANVRAQNKHQRSVILDSIAHEALEQSLNFVLKLLLEESKEEDCELSPYLPVESSHLKSTLEILESQKADVSLSDQGIITPAFSTISYCFWNSTSKSKHAKPA